MNQADRKEFELIHNKIDDIKKDIDEMKQSMNTEVAIWYRNRRHRVMDKGSVEDASVTNTRVRIRVTS